MFMYKFGILTSLYDDYAPQLLATIDRAIEEGVIEGEVPIVFCDRKPGKNPDVDARIDQVRRLNHMKNLVFLPPSGVWHEEGADKQAEYDKAATGVLADSGASSFLNIGYMRIMTEHLYGRFDIVNLHPALPKIGPVGMWPGVMKEQAERPIDEFVFQKNPEMQRIMSDRFNKAGGMLHLLSSELDRGPVLSWYEFSLDTPRLNELWIYVANDVRNRGLAAAKEMPYFAQLAAEIRREQVQGEHPLLVLTYSNLSRGNWAIRDRVLYVGDEPQPNGVDITREVGYYLRSRALETAIVKV